VPSYYNLNFCSYLNTGVCNQCSKDDNSCLSCTGKQTLDALCATGSALGTGVVYDDTKGNGPWCKDMT
jgi:hypothetical protein